MGQGTRWRSPMVSKFGAAELVRHSQQMGQVEGEVEGDVRA